MGIRKAVMQATRRAIWRFRGWLDSGLLKLVGLDCPSSCGFFRLSRLRDCGGSSGSTPKSIEDLESRKDDDMAA